MSIAPVASPGALHAKPRPTLLPPRALSAVAELLSAEADEHGERWKTRTADHHLDAAGRHYLAHLSGETTDPSSGRPHLVHFAARALMAADVAAAGVPTKDQGDGS